MFYINNIYLYSISYVYNVTPLLNIAISLKLFFSLFTNCPPAISIIYYINSSSIVSIVTPSIKAPSFIAMNTKYIYLYKNKFFQLYLLLNLFFSILSFNNFFLTYIGHKLFKIRISFHISLYQYCHGPYTICILATFLKA